MKKSDVELLKKIADRVLSTGDYCDSDATDVLKRLATSENAKEAWLKLSKKKMQPHDFYKDIFDVAEMIANIGQEALYYSPIIDNETPRKAAKYANQLLNFIKLNINKFDDYDLTPKCKASALGRIRMCLTEREIAENKIYQDYDLFSNKTEKMLEFVRNILDPNHESERFNITSNEAFKIVLREDGCSRSLVPQLEKFIEIALNNASRKPAISRPTKELARENEFAIAICHILKKCYGSPLYDISTSLCWAVFDEDFEVDTIKKWYQRRLIRDSL